MIIKTIILVLVAQIWASVGQILFKRATNTLSVGRLRGVGDHLLFLRDILASPLIWWGLASMTIALAVWLLALSQADLSFVFPIGSSQYLLILVLAHFFLGEKIDTMKVVGTVLVTAGIILTVMG